MKLQLITMPHGHLNSSDLTADEKKILNQYMGGQGASPAFVYERFFDKGFDEWELEGIGRIQERFLAENGLTDYESSGMNFYDYIGRQRGLKVDFCERMAQMGMTARLTVQRRFTADDWKPFERVGIRHLADAFDAYLQECMGDGEKETAGV